MININSGPNHSLRDVGPHPYPCQEALLLALRMVLLEKPQLKFKLELYTLTCAQHANHNFWKYFETSFWSYNQPKPWDTTNTKVTSNPSSNTLNHMISHKRLHYIYWFLTYIKHTKYIMTHLNSHLMWSILHGLP